MSNPNLGDMESKNELGNLKDKKNDGDSVLEGEARMCGYLWKKHRKNKLWKGWHKRYFVLTHGMLLYYRSEKEASTKGKKPRGEVTLGENCTIEEEKESTEGGKASRDISKFIVFVPPAGMIHLGGSSKEEASEWITKLRTVIREQKVQPSMQDNEESSSDDDDDEEDKIGISTVNLVRTDSERVVSNPQSPSAVEGASKHGILLKKKTGWVKGWHKRYFILRGNSIRYYRVDLKNNQISSKTFRDNIVFTNDFKVEWDGSKEMTGKGEVYTFTLAGPNCSLKVAAKTQEEAQSWVDELKKSIAESPEKERRSSITGPRDRPARLARSDQGPVSPASSRPTSRHGLSPRRKRGHHRVNTLPSLRSMDQGSPASHTSSTSPLVKSLTAISTMAWNAGLLEGWLWKKYQRKTYWSGWHLRYFVLSGNTMTYYKDARKRRVYGSVVLGSDCFVEFRESNTIVVKRSKTLYQFVVFLDGPPTKAPSMKTSIQLATPKLQDAKRWTEALTQAVYGPQSGENTKFHIVESDDEGIEEKDLKDVEECAVKFGDRIRLYTHTAYDASCPGGFIGIYRKPGYKDHFCVPPVGPMVAPELHDDVVFTVVDPAWPPYVSAQEMKGQPSFGSELSYGDAILLCDDEGRIWCQDSYYIHPKKRTSLKREIALVFHQMDPDPREGDLVRFGENFVLKAATMRKKGKRELKTVKNYKKGSSRLLGGYLNWSGQGHPISFTVQREAGQRRGSGIQCTFEVLVTNSTDTKAEARKFVISNESNVDLGVLFKGKHRVEVTVKDFSDPIVVDIPEPNHPYSKQIIVRSYKLNDNTVLHCHWGCRNCWKTNTVVSEDDSWGILWWMIFAMAMWSCAQTILNGEFQLALYITLLIFVTFPLLLVVNKASTLDNTVKKWPLKGIRSKASWSLSLALGHTSMLESKENEPNLAPAVDVAVLENDSKEAKTVPKVFVGKIAAGSTILYSTPENPTENSYTQSHFHNFKVRCGPNYKKTKKKAPSRREMYDLVSIDTVKTDRKIAEFVKNITFTPETVDELHGRAERLAKNRPELNLPPILTVHLSWPNYQPPNPLWGKAVIDGPGIVFTLVFKACDWIDDAKVTGS
uniref:PH domain-containing protein n=1 Tax=Lotharella globosa TaxID=91324 RepID=A0A7S3Z4R8_9EUKA|mmetsp:Transcript_23091/g.46314  ORF Transcript_23091/g.46314 Transcript_23091/m.46314 type:complete len:1102 (-) Transcript_23091:772-4077(-)